MYLHLEGNFLNPFELNSSLNGGLPRSGNATNCLNSPSWQTPVLLLPYQPCWMSDFSCPSLVRYSFLVFFPSVLLPCFPLRPSTEAGYWASRHLLMVFSVPGVCFPAKEIRWTGGEDSDRDQAVMELNIPRVSVFLFHPFHDWNYTETSEDDSL